MIRPGKFTPHVLASAPRRSAGIPNSDCSAVLYTLSTYSFETHEAKKELRLLTVARGGESIVLSEAAGIREPNWLGDETVLALRDGGEGRTEMVVGNVFGFRESPQVAGVIDGPAENVKLVKVSDDEYLVSFTAKAKPDGTVYNPDAEEKATVTGQLYDKTFVRHWDAWRTSNCNSIWCGTLARGRDGSQFKLSEVVNVLKGTGLESPIPPFGGGDHYDLSPTGLVFVAKDPDLNPAWNTKCNLYLFPFVEGRQSFDRAPLHVPIPGFEGACTSPAFSPDGQQIAFLSMRENGYESDKNQLFVMPNVQRPFWLVHCMTTSDSKEGAWDRSPESVVWSKDSMTLYLTAEDEGRACLFSYFIATNAVVHKPTKVTFSGSVSDVRPLASRQVFLSGSSLVENSWYMLLDPVKPPLLISANLDNGGSVGISAKQVSEIRFQGAKRTVQAWVIKPSTFLEKFKYPLAILVHGGPQGAWLDSWSTRWNPLVLAEQGYVVVAPNLTGSTGFGRCFQDDIRNNWGTLPYEDLVKCFEYIGRELSYVFTSRAVLLGASYGGYMVNWVQGQPLGRKFKALVCHDGIFSTSSMTATDELYFPEHDFGGEYPRTRGIWLKNDPSKYVHNWSTPQLVIHSERDYRIPISDGLAAFNMLQRRKVESQLLVFPDENHWVLNPENSVYWHTVVFNWINRHVGLPPYGSAKPIAGASEGEVTKPPMKFCEANESSKT